MTRAEAAEIIEAIERAPKDLTNWEKENLVIRAYCGPNGLDLKSDLNDALEDVSRLTRELDAADRVIAGLTDAARESNNVT